MRKKLKCYMTRNQAIANVRHHMNIATALGLDSAKMTRSEDVDKIGKAHLTHLLEKESDPRPAKRRRLDNDSASVVFGYL